jgi:outer membrane receptor for ferrienterochelin and colicins
MLGCRKKVLVILLGAMCAMARAEKSPGDGRDYTELPLEDLLSIEIPTVVAASKFEQKATQAPSTVSVISAEDIRHYGHRTLADVLRTVRGFYVTDNRNYNFVGVRGFGRPGDYNSRVLLLIDGHRTNESFFGQASIGGDFPLDIDLIDRVEIIRGPGSSLYGTGAFFGVINVITKHGKEFGGVEASAQAGSFDARSGRLT